MGLTDYLFLFAGMALLMFSGDALVRGAVGLAHKFGISPLVIGLTIVALGTSAPELMVSLDAALAGSGGIALGNVVGSNIANILLVLGVPAILKATDCYSAGTTRNTVFMVLISLLFIVFCFWAPLDIRHAAVFIVLLLAFIGYNIYNAQHSPASEPIPEVEELEDVTVGMANRTLAVWLIIGCIGLPLGADWTVDGASGIARSWGVSESAIALTLISLGTSLPELATTVMAAWRGHAAVAIGNVLGSNVFNILAILGITAAIVPIDVPTRFLTVDLWVMLVTSLILLPFVVFKWTISRRIGIAMTSLYGLYVASVFVVGNG
jgi:cation:H+ antiporter